MNSFLGTVLAEFPYEKARHRMAASEFADLQTTDAWVLGSHSYRSLFPQS